MANATGNKSGGRQKGTPNGMNKELRSILKDLLNKELDRQPDTLDTKDRFEKLNKLMPNALPKVCNISHKANEAVDWY